MAEELMRTGMMRIGLALGGGGARGLAHLGVIRRLQELNIPIHCVAGTSIGAIMAGVMAAGNVNKALAWCAEPDWKKLPRLFIDGHFTNKALISGNQIERLLAEFVPVDAFTKFNLPCAMVATELRSGEEVVLRARDACWWTGGSSIRCPCGRAERWGRTASSPWTSRPGGYPRPRRTMTT